MSAGATEVTAVPAAAVSRSQRWWRRPRRIVSSWAVVPLMFVGAAAVPGKIPPVASLLMLVAMPFVARSLRGTRWLKPLLLWAAVWTVVTVAADAVDAGFGSATVTSALRPLVLLAGCLFGLALERLRAGWSAVALAAFVAGSGVVGILSEPSYRGSVGDLWKYFIGFPICLAAVLLYDHMSQGERWRRVVIVVPLALVALSAVLGARSLALTLLLGFAVVGLVHVWQRGRRLARVVAVLGVLVVAAGIYTTYGFLASRGDLGQVQRAKWIAGTHAAGGPVIQQVVGNRANLVVAGVMIGDSPWSGAGSRLDITPDEERRAIRDLQDARVSTQPSDIAYYFRDGTAYLHSKIAAEWAAHGVVAFLCILAVPTLMWLALITVPMRQRTNRFAAAFLVTFFTWDLLFSPWTSGTATALGVALAVVLAPAAARRRRHAVG